MLHEQDSRMMRVHIKLFNFGGAENLVCGEAIIKPSDSTREHQLRVSSGGLQDSTEGLPLLFP